MFFKGLKIKVFAILVLAGVQHPTVGAAQHDHSHSASAPVLVQEPGQGTFAAISEIVALLGADADTDWSKVNITALRRHLVDMSELMLISTVKQAPITGGLRMIIDVSLPQNAAAGRMVKAHGPVLAQQTGWQSTVSQQGTVVSWEVVSPPADERIRALGFYGLMATGDHHIAHHIALARGKAVH